MTFLFRAPLPQTAPHVSPKPVARRTTVSGLLLALASWGCAPGFFATEVWPQAAPIHDPAAEAEVELHQPQATTGCSPKGCLPDASNAVPPASTGASVIAPVPFNIPHPLRDKASEEIDRLVGSDLESLGSMSFGTATRGALINAVHLPRRDSWELVDPPNAWGTVETVNYLTHAVDRVRSQFPNSHPLFVGDISSQRGGYLKPHLSHQSGKDVDVSYYYTQDPQWYARAHAGNLDRSRTWALIRTLLAETDVHFLFIDRSVQRLLRSYAEDIGEDREWLNGVFRGRPGEPAIIRHEPGHATHMHVRFYSPIAEETARRCYSSLIQQKKMLPMRYNITHLVSKGDTLIGLAKRYGTTVRAIKHANGMKTSMIQANRRYYIPRLGPAGPTAPKPLPPRRVPPARTSTGGPMALGPASPSGTVLSVGGAVVWAASSAPSILSSP